MDLGHRIAAWRKQKRLTQKQLAVKIGVTPAAVCRWERTGEAQNTPSHDNLVKIVRALGLTMSRFWGETPKRRTRVAA